MRALTWKEHSEKQGQAYCSASSAPQGLKKQHEEPRLNAPAGAGCHTKFRFGAKLGNGEGGRENASSLLLWFPGERLVFLSAWALSLTPKAAE